MIIIINVSFLFLLQLGLVLIGDFTGYSLSHLAHVNMALTKKLMPVWEVFSILRLALY